MTRSIMLSLVVIGSLYRPAIGDELNVVITKTENGRVYFKRAIKDDGERVPSRTLAEESLPVIKNVKLYKATKTEGKPGFQRSEEITKGLKYERFLDYYKRPVGPVFIGRLILKGKGPDAQVIEIWDLSPSRTDPAKRD